MSRQRVLSGMRPTGRLHYGNYLGALKNWVNLQEEFDGFFFVADLHALSSEYAEAGGIAASSLDNVKDWLAAGLDPDKSTIFVQSWLPEHSELHVLFSMITPLGWLERVPTYKDQLQQLSQKDLHTYGFLGYPCLQSADILLYKPHFVPVGEDQVAHIELTREIARRFHFLFGKEIFPEPQARLTEFPKVPGLDGRKMSKSYGNSLYLSQPRAEVWEKIRPMPTDPARIKRTDPGNPDVCNVFTYHKLFTSEEVRTEVAEGCRSAGIGCIDCKKKLMDGIERELGDLWTKRAELDAKPQLVKDVLEAGSNKAQAFARQTLDEAKEVVKLLKR